MARIAIQDYMPTTLKEVIRALPETIPVTGRKSVGSMLQHLEVSTRKVVPLL